MEEFGEPSVIDHEYRPRRRLVASKPTLRRTLHTGAAVSLLISGALGAGPAAADVKYDIGATSQYQYNTNVFDLPAGYAVLGQGNRRGDSFYTYGAQGSVDYLLSQQDFFLRGTVTDFRYDHFSELTHYEYTADGGWNFKLGSEWDGTLEVLRNRTMVTFAELNQQTLSLQTEQRERGGIRFHFLPDWRIGISGYSSDISEPTVQSPALKLTENQGASTLEYLGVANLTAGVTASYLTGKFSGNTGLDTLYDLDYHQTAAGLTAAYKLSGKSTLDVAAGYSDRTSVAAADTLSGFTGNIALHDQLTAKTVLTVRVSRAINSYIANAGSEIDSIGHIDVAWQATFKTGFTLGYNYTYSDLPGQGVGPGGSRIDHMQYATVGIDYEPARWLSIRPYANFTTRHSNVFAYAFSGNIYGVNFLAHIQEN